MASTEDKKLFTPGPLTCSASVKSAMLRDLGSRDTEFKGATKYVRDELLKVAQVDNENWTCVPMQGSGSFAVEAVLQTAIPRQNGKVLILANGAYGKRMMKMCESIGIDFDVNISSEAIPVPLEDVKKWLKSGNQYNLVAIVHCETSSGVVNNVEKIAELVKSIQPKSSVFVDAMSSFGAISLDLQNCDWMVSSANKCLQGVPGFAYAICRKSKLQSCKGNCRSWCLDLHDQAANLEKTGQFRSTPPTHTFLAFKQALLEFWAEGGLEGRTKRYNENREILKSGMAKLGFQEFVAEKYAGYIITSYLTPSDLKSDFDQFHEKLSEKGQVIYPGKVTDADTFRIGNIGHLFPQDMKVLLNCIEKVLQEMNVSIPVKY